MEVGPSANPLSGMPHPNLGRPPVTACRLPPRVAVMPLADKAPAAAEPAAPAADGGAGQLPQPQSQLHQHLHHQQELGWLLQLVNGLWPYTREAVEKMAWELIPQQLEASRPAFVYELKMEKFSLGEAQPTVSNMHVHRGDELGIDELFLEFDIEWHSEQDISLLIVVPRLPVAVAELTPDPLEDALRLIMQLRVALRDAWVQAGVRVSLRPLLHRLPVVGAVQVGLTRVPNFGYELDLSLLSAALVPLIKEWLDSAVRDLVLQPWVLPEHFFFPLDPGVRDVVQPAGVLAVRVLDARDVPKPGLLGSTRPMLELFVRDSQRRQTHVAPAGTSASWGTRFEFPVSLPEHQELSVILYDFSDFSPNDELGRAQLPLRDLQPERQQQVTLLMQPRAEQHHAEEQRRMGLADRVALALGRPFTKKGSSVCKLRLEVTYIPLDKAAAALVMQQQTLPVSARNLHGVGSAEGTWSTASGEGGGSQSGILIPRAAEPQQAPKAAHQQPAGGPSSASVQLHPLVVRLLLSGLLVVHVKRAEGMVGGLGSSLFKPYYKAVVRVGERQAETDAAKASRQGAVEFSRPAALHLEPEVAQQASAQVELELWEHIAAGGVRSCGRLVLPLADLVQGGQVTGERQLAGGRGWVQLEARFVPYF